MRDAPIVRIATQADAGTLAEFNIAMASETEGIELAPEVVEIGVRSLIEDTARGFYVVAQWDEQIVGSLMITTEWSDWRNAFFWWIQSVYVAPLYRRQGIYRRLYEFVKRRAAIEDRVCGFRLYVEDNNETAQRTYRSLGMYPTRYLIFEESI